MTRLHQDAVAAFQAGDLTAALALFEAARAEDSANAVLLNDYGCCLTALGRETEARPLFFHAVEIAPHYADAWHNLGVASAALGEAIPAFEALRRALKLDLTRTATMKALGRLLLADHQPEAALRLFESAAHGAPADGEAFGLLAAALVDLGRADDAERAFATAAARAPEDAESLFALANLLDDRGKRDAAESAYRRAIAVSDHPLAFGRLLTLLGERSEPELVERARALTDDVHTPAKNRAHIGYGLARALDRMGNANAAFTAAATANAARRELAGPYDRELASQRIDRLIHAFTPELMERWAGAGDPSDLPVFVVGMPRSGTTLTERLIAAHPLGAGAGERPEVARAATTMPALLGVSEAWPECIGAMTADALHQTAQDILAPLTRAARASAVRAVDKQPLNLFHVGLIALALPNAKIIHCVRDPRDVLTSIFFEDFTPSQAYATDLGDLASFYHHTERLMAHWQRLLGKRIFVQSYEALVATPEREAQRLISALGLNWDDRVLQFYDGPAMVRTPSRWQVREPITTKAMGRWRRYEPHLEPLLRALKEQQKSS